MTDQPQNVFGGVDTHTDTHHAAVVDQVGRHLADAQFPTTNQGYRALLDWLRSHGTVRAVGVEGTGSYGTQLARVLGAAGLTVFDINRPDRRIRHQQGKSDPMPTPPPRPLPPAARPSSPRPTAAPPRPFASCTLPARPPSRPAPRRSTRSAATWSPHPTPCAPSSAVCPALISSPRAPDCGRQQT
ncbi:transposase [Streptomyces sp. NPDC088560]|uniref:IS110 family transposase n=1 Tax=Streptomyces sp. NPDC088560 TaxID=3365868 RepID=UPI003810F91B